VTQSTDLMAIGFTEYEARVYLTLLGENPATGYQLGKKAGIPRSMVYEALGRLHARGAILRTGDQRATLYRPVPPDLLLDRYAQEQERLTQSLRAGLNALYASEAEEHIWSISGESAVRAYALQIVQEAQTELLLVLPDNMVAALRSEIAAASARGVAVSSLLTGAAELDCGEVARHPPLESQLQELTTMFLIVADGKQCLMASVEPEMTATLASNRNLVFIARQFVWMELFTQRLHRAPEAAEPARPKAKARPAKGRR
jgi:HTH-type transcriptional regulator, sugar sensing transcriptional regulator